MSCLRTRSRWSNRAPLRCRPVEYPNIAWPVEQKTRRPIRTRANPNPPNMQAGAEPNHRSPGLKIASIRTKNEPLDCAACIARDTVDSLASDNTSLTVLGCEGSASATTQSVAQLILKPRGLWPASRDARFAAAVTKHLASCQYDFVVSQTLVTGCNLFFAQEGVHAEWRAQQRRVTSGFSQLIAAFHPRHRHRLAAERAMYESTTLRAVICNSQMVKADIQRHFDIDAAKLRVILSGVDSTVFHPGLREIHRAETRKALRIPKAAPVALFVGSGFERKGLIGFLMGLADQEGHGPLTRESVRGIVVGHDKHLVRFQSFADQLGLSDRVTFVGGVDDVKPFYAAADVFVLPTLYDPLPNACLEAMACGLPTITSTGSGAAELISNGVEGFVVDALDTPAIADAIGAALDSAMTDNQMGLNAAKRVAGLTPRNMAAAYVALYRELLGRPALSAAQSSPLSPPPLGHVK